MELGVWLWMIGSLHFVFYTQPRVRRNTPYEVEMMFVEEKDCGGNCMEGWGWMGHEDQDLRNMGEEDTWHGRWTLFFDLLGDNSLGVLFPWQGYLCWRNCVGYEWNCMQLKDNEVDFPCQRQKNNEHEMDESWV